MFDMFLWSERRLLFIAFLYVFIFDVLLCSERNHGVVVIININSSLLYVIFLTCSCARREEVVIYSLFVRFMFDVFLCSERSHEGVVILLFIALFGTPCIPSNKATSAMYLCVYQQEGRCSKQYEYFCRAVRVSCSSLRCSSRTPPRLPLQPRAASCGRYFIRHFIFSNYFPV